MQYSHAIIVLLLLVALNIVAAFITAPLSLSVHQRMKLSSYPSVLYAKKPKKKKGGGGGFGSKPTTKASYASVSADKNSLESQWDNFASITDLEITPQNDPEDDDYEHFIVADVFVRVGPSENGDDKTETGWYRTGKVVASGDDAEIHAALTLQKGLILWTSVHMWPQLAAKGKDAAKRMEIGTMPPTLNMADETDTVLDDDEAEDVEISSLRVSVKDVSIKTVGFRPDFNLPGFTYKRREKAAMKKKKSAMEEIADAM